MLNENSKVEELKQLNKQIYLLKIHSPVIALQIKPGQFVNIKISESNFPLLRRPFSVCDVDGEFFYIMFHIVGEGTKLLTQKQKGDELDILGPLGNGFNVDGEYETAVFAAGGIGQAPFPYLNRVVSGKKEIISFIGGRTSDDVVTYGVDNPIISTDDGAQGFHGNVVQLMKQNIELLKSKKIKIFACGPTPMLKAVSEFSKEYNFDCEISTESAMACGFGICQGCPVESAHQSDKYLLVCKDGPVFNAKDIKL